MKSNLIPSDTNTGCLL